MNTDHAQTGQRSGAEAGQQPLTPAQTEWTIPRRLRTGWHSRWWLVEAGLSLACVGLAVAVGLAVWILPTPGWVLILLVPLLPAGLALMIAAAQQPPRRARPWLYALAWLQGALLALLLLSLLFYPGIMQGAMQ
jgi:hypothetical protein